MVPALFLYLCSLSFREAHTPEAQLPRRPPLKLFGKSDWVSNWDSEGRQEGTKEARLATFRCQRTTLEKPSAIFQTVSLGNPVNRGIRITAGACIACSGAVSLRPPQPKGVD